jgi:beta-glucanase (GH16 family)
MFNKFFPVLFLLFSVGSLFAQFNPVFNNLVWADEFNGSGAINDNKWFHQTLLPNGTSWWNGEQQHYTDEITNSYVNNGFLNIVARKEVYSDQGVTKNYTSARLNSKFAFTYGRVEVMAKLPYGEGTWPAIWTLGKNITENGGFWASTYGTTGWPACGEIDIMEHWGHNPNYIQSALHNSFSSGNTINHGGIMASDVANNFHLYAMEWTENEIKFSLDSVVFYEYNPQPKNIANWPYFQDQYLLLNIAMGSSWFSIDPFFNSSKMEVDYVRVYQASPTVLNPIEETSSLSIYPMPYQDQISFVFKDNLPISSAYLYTFLGKQIKLFSCKEDINNYSWESLKSGTYFIKINHLEKSSTHKIIKL